MKRRDKRRQRDALDWLIRVQMSAQYQIDNGDLDFDDVLYRGRHAARTLLEIFLPEEKTNV